MEPVTRRTALRAAIACIGVLFVGVAFAASYVGALHEPKPHRIPLAVAGPDAVAARVGGSPAFAVHRYASGPAAAQAVRERHVDGALIVGDSRPTVVVASAGGPSVADVLRSRLAPQLHATVSDVAPLPANDARGLAAFYVVVAWTVTGYLGATFLGLLFGIRLSGAARIGWRLLALACLSLAAGFATLAAVRAFGPLQHAYVRTSLAGALAVFAVAAATVALQSVLGLVGTGVAIVVFVVLGNPASGGIFAAPLLPGLWRSLTPVLPTGAAVETVRNLSFFPDASSAAHLLTLAAWAAGGCAAAVATGAARARFVERKFNEAV
ncbi:MAG: DUF3533 domain-containing protein [Actinomycetota bacterium]